MSITIQTCEVCQVILDDLDPLEPCSCANRQSPEFYKWGAGSDIVYYTENFEVACVGEMRIYVSYKNASGLIERTIRYADDLEQLGINTDKDLQEHYNLGEESFCVSLNPWFEVYSTENEETYSDPIYELDEAVALAVKWQEEHDKN